MNKIVGTPINLSPNRSSRHGRLRRASDIYSLGCTLYYAVCAKSRFRRVAVGEAKRHLEETPWHPRRFIPGDQRRVRRGDRDMMEKSQKSASSRAGGGRPFGALGGEANPIPSLYLTNERWAPPPIPTGREVETGRPDFVPIDVEDFDSRSQESPSQLSQGTDRSSPAGTTRRRSTRSRRGGRWRRHSRSTTIPKNGRAACVSPWPWRFRSRFPCCSARCSPSWCCISWRAVKRSSRRLGLPTESAAGSSSGTFAA